MTPHELAKDSYSVLPLWHPSAPSVASELGISRDLAYRLGREGALPVIRLGRRVVVSRVALNRFLNGNSEGATSGQA